MKFKEVKNYIVNKFKPKTDGLRFTDQDKEECIALIKIIEEYDKSIKDNVSTLIDIHNNFKQHTAELKELQEKLNSANRVIYMQMQEIQELNNICEYNDKAHIRELERKDAVIEYLEGKI